MRKAPERMLAFALLVILGIVVDPTTAGVGDSKRAMGYVEPWVDEPDELHN